MSPLLNIWTSSTAKKSLLPPPPSQRPRFMMISILPLFLARNPVHETDPKKACSGSSVPPIVCPCFIPSSREFSQSSPKVPTFFNPSLSLGSAETEPQNDAHSMAEGAVFSRLPVSVQYLLIYRFMHCRPEQSQAPTSSITVRRHCSQHFPLHQQQLILRIDRVKLRYGFSPGLFSSIRQSPVCSCVKTCIIF